jgi:hypothetical protein
MFGPDDSFSNRELNPEESKVVLIKTIVTLEMWVSEPDQTQKSALANISAAPGGPAIPVSVLFNKDVSLIR